MFYKSLLPCIQSTSMLYNSLLSYTINFEVLQLSTILQNHLRRFTISTTILYNLLRRFTALYSLIQATSLRFTTLYLSCTINFDVITTLYYLKHSTSTFSNSPIILYTQLWHFTTLYSRHTITFEVLHHSSFLFHQLRRFTTLSFLKQSTSKCYNSLLSYKTTLTFYISLLSCTIIFGGLLLSTLLYNQLRRFTTLSYIHQLRCYTTLYYLTKS